MDVDPGFSETSLIGEPLVVELSERAASFRGLNKQQCKPDSRFPADWTLSATVPQDEPTTSGDTVEGWIFEIDESSKEVTVTTDSFGRADLHSLKDRHVEAADHIAYLALTEVDDPQEVDIEQVSHAKGLLSRCIRKDQWDWYTVYRLLGKPPVGLLRQGRQALTQLREAVKDGDEKEVERCITELGELGVVRRFAYFVRRVNLGEEYGVIDDEYLLQKLYRLDPLDFEQFVADLWGQLGWETEVVPVVEDRGADIIATQSGLFTRRRAIQVKRKKPTSVHNLAEVQRYTGLTRRENIDEVLFVTTGQLTEKARDEESISSYKLIDGSELCSFIQDNDLHHIVDQYVDISE